MRCSRTTGAATLTLTLTLTLSLALARCGKKLLRDATLDTASLRTALDQVIGLGLGLGLGLASLRTALDQMHIVSAA